MRRRRKEGGYRIRFALVGFVTAKCIFSPEYNPHPIEFLLLLMTIAERPLSDQPASGLNFYDDSGCSPLAD